MKNFRILSETVQYLDSPALPTDRIGKWGAYVSVQEGENIRSCQADFDSKEQAQKSIPDLLAMAVELLPSTAA